MASHRTIANAFAERLRAEDEPLTAAVLHRLRRAFSKDIARCDGRTVIAIACQLAGTPRLRGRRVISCALVGQHPGALAVLGVKELERLGAGFASWGDVDVFGCLVAGRAWRDGAIRDATIHRWARSSDRWWRRAALVATVPLNVRAQGGQGDAKRTLAVCTLLVQDRDDMVIKGLSWALRELAVRDPRAVTAFLTKHGDVLDARVRREVRSKLLTGLKTHRRSETAAGRAQLVPDPRQDRQSRPR
jgi:hypothetical protein